jgi:hypothetical protein
MSGNNEKNRSYEGSLSEIFHTLIGYIYLIAFYSLYIQYRGLYGLNGLLPASDLINNVKFHFQSSNLRDILFQFPCIAIYASDFGIDAFCEAILLGGIMSSLFIICGYRSSSLFALNWIFYLR